MSSVENLNRIADNPQLKADLHKLITHQQYIESRIKELKNELKDIKINYTNMGLTDKEFKELCFYRNQPELLYYDLAVKEQYIPFVELEQSYVE